MLESISGFISNKYYKIYLKLCQTRQEQRPGVKPEPNYLYETHHIIPKSLGGNDDPSNLVNFTHREHFLAHRLLTKFLPTCSQMSFALWRMTNKNKNLNSRIYEHIRCNHISNLKGEGNPMYGRTHSEGAKDKISKINKGRVVTDDFRQKISIVTTGEKNPMYGRNHTETAKSKISEANRGEGSGMFGRRGKECPKFKGFYITPNGIYDSAKTAGEANNLSSSAVRQRCKYKNNLTIRGTKLDTTWIGKTWAELGWGFIPSDIEKVQ